MENLHLFVLLLLTEGVSLAPSTLRKYYLIQQEKSWSDAQAYCRASYVDLATIETSKDAARLQEAAQRYQFSGNAWIGMWDNVSTWRWSYANEPLTWSDWALSQPDNKGGHEACGGGNKWNWFDAPCAAKFPFVCFDAGSPSPYTYYPTEMTWSDAQTYCRTHHTDLASPKTNSENLNMKSYLDSFPGNCWFGPFRDYWKWSDQTPFSDITWMTDKLDNTNNNEDCGFVSNGEVHDDLCSALKSFFCYRFVTKQQQILRVKVQSDQDVNDPAVKAQILGQIKQNLRDRRMENVTVNWREQPDGVVFHKIKPNDTTTAQTAAGPECDV